MAESISLNNINIFQSEGQYLENKDSLSASDINLIPQEEIISIEHGGTGATTAEDARINLGIPTYSNATTSAAGLMSATDKTKLNGLVSSGSGVFYATCSTAVGTTAKVATVTSGTFSLKKGVVVFLYATNAIKGGKYVTLNVNSSGAKHLYFDENGTSWGTYSTGDCDFYSAGNYIICVYDGTNWKVYSEVTYISQRVGT